MLLTRVLPLALLLVKTHQSSFPWQRSSVSTGTSDRNYTLRPACEDYSFDFTFQPGVESAFRRDNVTAVDDYDEYETFNITFVEPTDYSEASYNFLLFPFLHPFKAPNVVALENNITDTTPTPGSNKSWISNLLDFSPTVTISDSLASIDEEERSGDQNYTDLLKLEVLQDLEGCYSYVLPFLALNFQSETLATDQEEAQNDVKTFGNLYSSIHHINDGFESSHMFSSDSATQVANKIGSYFGISYQQDMSVMKCYVQERLPETFEEMRIHFKTIQITKVSVEKNGREMQENPENWSDLLKSLMTSPMSAVSALVPSYVPLIRSVSDYPMDLYMSSSIPQMVRDVSSGVPEVCSVSLSNDCWRQVINRLQSKVTQENIGASLNYLLSYLDYVPLVLNIAASMMSGIASTDNFSCISCSYDIIANDDLHWDSDKPTFAGESLLHTLLKPIGRETLTTLPLKIKKTYENLEVDQNGERLIVLVGELKNRTREMIQSDSLKILIQKKMNYLLDWLREVDIEKIHLNSWKFISTVTNCMANLGDSEVNLKPLVDTILERIHGDKFWDVLEELVVYVVNKRWLRVLAVVDHQLAPLLQKLSLSLDWLNIDFRRNSRHLLDRAVNMIDRNLQEEEGLFGYFQMRRIISRTPEVLQCSKGEVSEEDVWELARLSYSVLTVGLDYLEPTFGLLEPRSVCQLLEVCGQTEEDFARAALSLKGKMVEVLTPVMEIKRAIFCRNRIITKDAFWATVLQ